MTCKVQSPAAAVRTSEDFPPTMSTCQRSWRLAQEKIRHRIWTGRWGTEKGGKRREGTNRHGEPWRGRSLQADLWTAVGRGHQEECWTRAEEVACGYQQGPQELQLQSPGTSLLCEPLMSSRWRGMCIHFSNGRKMPRAKEIKTSHIYLLSSQREWEGGALIII